MIYPSLEEINIKILWGEDVSSNSIVIEDIKESILFKEIFSTNFKQKNFQHRNTTLKYYY